MIAKAQLDLLRRRIGGQLPGLEAHERMMPATRKTIYRDITIPDNAKKSATLILLYPSENGLHFPLIERTEYPGVHSKQISFPGGAWEESDPDYIATALREAEEEIGILPGDVHVLGRLSQLITISSFRVSPIVGVIPWPYTFKVAGIEVARVFTIPLPWLANKNNYWEFSLRESERSLIAYHPYDGELLWGATARMTVNFLKTLDLLK